MQVRMNTGRELPTMTSAAPPKPFTNNPQETSLGVWWSKVDGAAGYQLKYRQFPQEWSTAQVCVLPSAVAAGAMVTPWSPR